MGAGSRDIGYFLAKKHLFRISVLTRFEGKDLGKKLQGWLPKIGIKPSVGRQS